MSPPLNLEAYFERVGYRGPREPTLAVLHALTLAHVRAIPFENLDVPTIKLRFNDQWNDVCEFTLEEMPLIDREVANWFTSTHPEGHFKSRLIAARAELEGKRLTVADDEFTIRDRTGHAEKHPIRTPAELLDILDEHFGLHFPPDTRFELRPPIAGGR